jgi:restriction system protein
MESGAEAASEVLLVASAGRGSRECSSSAVRDFRGTITSRGEKGLIITTGVFTPSAITEATRDGAPPVDLVNGDALCDLLKEFRIGVAVRQRIEEDIQVDDSFFETV